MHARMHARTYTHARVHTHTHTHKYTHTHTHTHTHYDTHILIPFEDRKPTGLKVDIAEDADKLVLSHPLTRLTSREWKTRRTPPSNTSSKWPTQQTTATRHSKRQEQYQSTTEANSKHWFTTARSVPLKMSIGSVLKPNDLVEIAVLPRSSVVAYREGIKLLFLRRQQVRCSGRRREA